MVGVMVRDGDALMNRRTETRRSETQPGARRPGARIPAHGVQMVSVVAPSVLIHATQPWSRRRVAGGIVIAETHHYHLFYSCASWVWSGLVWGSLSGVVWSGLVRSGMVRCGLGWSGAGLVGRSRLVGPEGPWTLGFRPAWPGVYAVRVC